MAKGKRWEDEGLLLRHFVCYGGVGWGGVGVGEDGMGFGREGMDGMGWDGRMEGWMDGWTEMG